jgi:hypothetical protein
MAGWCRTPTRSCAKTGVAPEAASSVAIMTDDRVTMAIAARDLK